MKMIVITRIKIIHYRKPIEKIVPIVIIVIKIRPFRKSVVE